MSYKKRNFMCPSCKGHLRINTKIILGVEKLETGAKGLVLLSPQTGDYEVITHEKFTLKNGDKLKIYCPICGEDLKSEDKPGLCHLLLDIGTLYFAPDKGQHATFIEDHNGKLIKRQGGNQNKFSTLFPGFKRHEGNETDHEHAAVRG